MQLLRPISIVASLLVTVAGASAQVPLTPPAAQAPANPPAAKKETPKETPKQKARLRRSSLQRSSLPRHPSPWQHPGRRRRRRRPPPRRRPPSTIPIVDLVYGAYQRGLYKTAFDLATTRAQFNRDPKAMTMLGELYANALGIKRDYAKAAEWYQRAADAGDREGMFALAMMRLSGRGGADQPRAGRQAAGLRGQARQPEGGL